MRQRAARDGRELAEEVADLLRKGLALPAGHAPASCPPRITTDPATGLPLIEGAHNAPISRMTTEEIYALIEQTQEEEDLERFRISLRR